MITRRMKIRRHLRSVRASALTEEERRQELRDAQARGKHDQGHGEQGESAAPLAAGDGAPRTAAPEAEPTDDRGEPD
jgi:hypothetical protein